MSRELAIPPERCRQRSYLSGTLQRKGKVQKRRASVRGSRGEGIQVGGGAALQAQVDTAAQGFSFARLVSRCVWQHTQTHTRIFHLIVCADIPKCSVRGYAPAVKRKSSLCAPCLEKCATHGEIMARKLIKFVILFDNTNLLYFPGQFLSGRVLVELEEDTPALGE